MDLNVAAIFVLEQYDTLQALRTGHDCIEIGDQTAADNARALSRATTDLSFIVARCCAKKVMVVTIVLSRSLQAVNRDFFEATGAIIMC